VGVMMNPRSLFFGTALGIILIFIGLSGPWLSYSAKWSYYANETDRYHGETLAEASPFLIKYTLNVTSSTSRPGLIREIVPLKIYLGANNKFFYDPMASLLGLFCTVGAVISLSSQFWKKQDISFFGGLLSLLATISFFITLPRNINVIYLTTMPHWVYTSIGAIVVMVSAISDSIESFIRAILNTTLLVT
jgi:hypothetical protein